MSARTARAAAHTLQPVEFFSLECTYTIDPGATLPGLVRDGHALVSSARGVLEGLDVGQHALFAVLHLLRQADAALGAADDQAERANSAGQPVATAGQSSSHKEPAEPPVRQQQGTHQHCADRIKSAWLQLDMAAAALRVWMVACGADPDECGPGNLSERQVWLRAIVEVLHCARGVLLETHGGNDDGGLPLLFCVELAHSAEQSLWVCLNGGRMSPPSNADLCSMLELVLQYFAQARTKRVRMPEAGAARQAGRAA